MPLISLPTGGEIELALALSASIKVNGLRGFF